ncbi:MAG: hypothetical protein FJ149_02370 [Euryarchaeota archaeon]|nr:hypothetical protein [Euryarchaeota archaeon]
MVSIKQGNDTIDTVENYCLPHPRDFVDVDDSVYIQASGDMSLSKVKGTLADRYIQEGYRRGRKLGIALKTDHEAAVLHLLAQQSKEVRRIKGQMPKNEYIVKNRYDIVVECKQIEAFENGRIKENPDNPNTLRNSIYTALRQHSESAQAGLPFLIMIWTKYQNRLPPFNKDDYLKEFTDGLPDNTFLIVSNGLLADLNYCEIYSRTTKCWVKADGIIEAIEADISSRL